ncbi:acylneuraminate cytidylyltransferase family protein [Helicobacter pullorum]
MLNDKTFLAIIPARSGSKRVIDKNIRNLYGKPMLAWSIRAGLNSQYIDEVMVATDSQKYADIARKYGASVPFIRPNSISQDDTPTFEVVKYTIEFYEKIGKRFDYIVLLQPTSPLRKSVHIDEACEKIFTKKADSIISVCECEHSPLWSNTIPKNDSMSEFFSCNIKHIRSQDLPKYYRLNGAIFVIQKDKFLLHEGAFMPNSYAYKMQQQFSIDVDTEMDCNYAEFLISGGGGYIKQKIFILVSTI